MFQQLSSHSKMPLLSVPDMHKVVSSILKVCHPVLLPETDIKSILSKSKAPASKFDSKLKVVGQICRFEFLEILVRIAKARFCTSEGEDIDPLTEDIAEGMQFLLSEHILEHYTSMSWS